jgi:beta-N-acetylhexosaminidase
MARELARAGVNVNFGPVVDFAVTPRNPVTAERKRSFGTDPANITQLARAFILAHREANVVTAAKHFPGHGSSRTDSHKDCPTSRRAGTRRRSSLTAHSHARGCSIW